MPVENIKNLFAKLHDYGPQGKEWVAQIISRVITADKIIANREKKYVQALFDPAITGITMSPQDILGKAMNDAIKGILELPAPPCRFAPEIQQDLISCLLEICVCDKDFHKTEIEFVKSVCQILEMDEDASHHLIKLAVASVKPQNLDKLIPHFTVDQRYWIAGVTLKLIGADERIDNNEIVYLQDIYKMVENPVHMIASIRDSESTEQDFWSLLPEVTFEQDHVFKILEYLMAIAGADGHVDEPELKLVSAAANRLKAPEDMVHKMLGLWQKSMAL
ncbi:MAG: TerB family tellurite resistance protein [SAR324 cluster bacterium]|nr:TerB family tellurite resistance protein [SAR324 cluster bacterium]